MSLKNLEESIVDRIRRAVAKELKALQRRTGTPRNGHSRYPALNRKAGADATGDTVCASHIGLESRP